MKLAIVNQVASTGGWRVLKQLLLSFKENIPEMDMTIFMDIKDIAIVDNIINELREQGIKFEQINIKYEKKYKYQNSLLNSIYNFIRKKVKKQKKYTWRNLYERLNQYDNVLFFWPYGILYPTGLNIPSYFIIHDLTPLYKFGFGGYHNMNMKAYLEGFFNQSTPIVLSNYGKQDVLEHFYIKKDIKVIPWSNFSEDKEISKETTKNVLKKYGLKPKEYVFYPTNNSTHKNNQLCLGIAHQLQKNNIPVKVVLCGSETEALKGEVAYTHILPKHDYDILGLGIIPDEELYVLIKNALCLITTTLAEGGCGPASDAWIMGCPTVISDIPVLKEYASLFKVSSEFAPPYNANEYADKILTIYNNPKKYQQICIDNQKQMAKNYTWKDVAEKYMKLFEENRKGK